MDFDLTPEQQAIREQARALAAKFDDAYWRRCDAEQRFPWEFYQAFAEAGWLGICIPPEYGGAGLGISEAAILLEEVAASGAAMNGASALHLTVFGLNPVVRHGSEELKRRILPEAAAGRLHVAFGVTEPDAGSDTPSITTRAIRDGDRFLIRGKKVWTSKALEATKVLLLARTTPLEQCAKRTDGMTLFLADLDRRYVTIRPIEKLGRNAVDSNEVFYDDLPVDARDVVGEVDKGFYHLLDGLNPERILVAAEALGIGKAALRRATEYARNRRVFGRPIGQNQGIQFPLADSYAKLHAAELMVRKAAWLYDHGRPCGAEANMAKYLASEWAFEAADRALQVHGGFGYAKEFDVERYWREVRVMRIAPVTQEMVLNFLAQHELGLPRSY
ncbi:MAG: acyl-CoA dehydrogenase family protein [Chloroflexota bacterium]|nr:acyl-CoA/acyl-ACP dehydrogenase [Dehalococcoidia bacterium]MDW8047171.1 acyl-CoA dehydrogenase family protein [Chloroflexota bacterium]